jgi:hypothetical protein
MFLVGLQIAEQKDFFNAPETEDENAAIPENQKRIRKMSSTELTDDEVEEEEDPEVGDKSDSEKEPAIYCHEHDEDAHLFLRLPVECKNGTQRSVDAHCAICVSEYEDGEKVVWSSCLECRHAFHYECMMPWLAKGKKRCPICRHWFVPGSRIDDQKKTLEERLRVESSSSLSSSDGAAETSNNANDETSSANQPSTEVVERSEQEAPVTEVDDQPALEEPEGQKGSSQQNDTDTEVDDQSSSEQIEGEENTERQTAESKSPKIDGEERLNLSIPEPSTQAEQHVARSA